MRILGRTRVHLVGVDHGRGLGRVFDHAVEEQLHGFDRDVGPRVLVAQIVEVVEHRVRVFQLIRSEEERHVRTQGEFPGVADRRQRRELIGTG